MRATSPYSIGALAGKGMHDACRMRALTSARGKAIALVALVFCLSGAGSRRRRRRNRQRARDLMRDRRSVRQGGGAAARLLHQAHLAGKLVPAERGQPRGRARGRPVHAGDGERARAHRSVRSRLGDPGLREVPQRAEAPLRQSGPGGGRLQRRPYGGCPLDRQKGIASVRNGGLRARRHGT